MHLMWFDLRRLARRGRFSLVRVLLGLALLAAVGARFASQLPEANLLSFETTYRTKNLASVATFSAQFAAAGAALAGLALRELQRGIDRELAPI